MLNKIDTISIEELDLLSRVPHYVPVCAGKEWNFDELLERVWAYLNMYRMCVSLAFAFSSSKHVNSFSVFLETATRNPRDRFLIMIRLLCFQRVSFSFELL